MLFCLLVMASIRQAQGPDAKKKSFDTEGLLYHYLGGLLHSMHWVVKLGMNNECAFVSQRAC
jgi:hypothetical protein